MFILFRIFLCAVSSAYFVFMLNLSGILGVIFPEYTAAWRIVVFLVFFVLTGFILKRLSLSDKPSADYVLNVVFVFIAGTGLFGGLIGLNIIGDVSEAEKRPLHGFPQRNPFHEKFPGEFDGFIDDRVGFRGEAFRLYSAVRPYMLDKFNIKKNAIEGREHWLFYNNENDTVGNFQAVKDYSAEELAALKKSIDEVYDFCNSNGIGFVFLMAPNKSSVYPEYYPDFIKRLDKPSSYERINKYLQENLNAPAADVFGAVLLQKKVYDTVFYREDSHWNSAGAYFAYRQAAKLIKERFPGFKIVEEGDLRRCDAKNSSRDLINLIGGTTYDYPPTNEFCIDNGVSENVIRGASAGQSGYTVTSYREGLRAIIFHDSFLAAMEKFLVQGMAEKVNVWFYRVSPLAYKKLILDYKPDIVIWEMQERYAPDFMNGRISYDGKDEAELIALINQNRDR